MSGVPGMTQLRSVSITGLSVVTLTFNEKTADYFCPPAGARTIAERLLPPGPHAGAGALTTAVGEIYRYVLDAPPTADREEIRAVQDWTVRPALRMVPGIAVVIELRRRDPRCRCASTPTAAQVRAEPERRHPGPQRPAANGSGGLLPAATKPWWCAPSACSGLDDDARRGGGGPRGQTGAHQRRGRSGGGARSGIVAFNGLGTT